MITERSAERFRRARKSLDVDNTVVGTYDRTLTLYNYFVGTSHRFEEIKSNWKLADWFEQDLKVPDGRRAATNFYNSRLVMVGAVPIAGAMSVLAQLKRWEDNPFFISARPGSSRGFTFEWFHHYAPWLDRELFLLQTDGNTINPGHKVDMINLEGIEYHFEDVPEDAREILNRTKATIVMVNQPWNLDFTFPENPGRLIRSADPLSMSNLAYAFRELMKRLA
jgi:hypothetical protein